MGGGPERIARAPRLRPPDRARTDRAPDRRRVLVRARTARRAGAAPRGRVTTGDGVITGLGARRRPEGVRDRRRATVLAGTTAPVNMRKQRPDRRVGRPQGPAADLPVRQRRRPHPGSARAGVSPGVPFDFATFLQSPPGYPAVPRIAAAVGPSFGDAALHAAMGDFVVMVESAAVALSGPPVIRAAIGEEVSATELGGPAVAAEISGSVHMVVAGRGRRPSPRSSSFSPTCRTRQPAPPRRLSRRRPSATPRSCCRSCRSRRAAAMTCGGCSTRSSTATRSCSGESATAAA